MRRLFLPFAIGILVSMPVAAEQLRVAAAASLAQPARALARDFEAETGIELKITLGSSGTLFNQIISGAPFSVFLSADTNYPDELERQGLTRAGNRHNYASGRLLLWVRSDSDLPPRGDARTLLSSPRLGRLAIANPKVAPYGVAAVELLRGLGLHRQVESRLVVGENVSQAAHLARAGAADAALVARSFRQSTELGRAGRWVEVPDELYSGIEHGLAVVGPGSSSSSLFVTWLLGPGGQRVLESHGLEPAGRSSP